MISERVKSNVQFWGSTGLAVGVLGFGIYGLHSDVAENDPKRTHIRVGTYEFIPNGFDPEGNGKIVVFNHTDMLPPTAKDQEEGKEILAEVGCATEPESSTVNGYTENYLKIQPGKKELCLKELHDRILGGYFDNYKSNAEVANSTANVSQPK